MAAVLLTLASLGCRGDAGPSARRVTLQPFGDTVGYGLPDSSLDEPLAVRALDASSGAVAGDVAITWRIVSGSGAAIGVHDARTDEFGVARVRLTLGSDTGTVVVQALAPGIVGSLPNLTVRTILRPAIAAIEPAIGAAGDTVVIRGAHFASGPAATTVRFGGVRGQLVAGSATELMVVVPACVTDREVGVDVSIGGVASEPAQFRTINTPAEPLRLAVGEARVFRGVELECMRFAADDGTQYLLVTQNVHGSPAPASAFELLGFRDLPPATFTADATAPPAPRQVPPSQRWEHWLRTTEAQWPAADVAAARVAGEAAALTSRLPSVGERRSFRVLTPDMKFTTVTAEVRHVSERTVIYQDLDAPAAGAAGGLTAADLAGFAQLFDDPIYATLVDVFGEPSDIDGNDRVVVLFTPKVNALTAPGEAGFIAAYFYGCDLVAASRCSGTNQAEIFYSMVPDPGGAFGKPRTRSDVLQTVPGVLAHEFQHMIHFARKGGTLDLLWLSEGLAHAAEDIVADVLQARGDATAAAEMRGDNTRRARDYLQRLATTSLVAEKAPGSLEMRGGAWLLVKYLTGHYGGLDLLRRLTVSVDSGIPNVEQQTGRQWHEILADFGLALYADGRGLPVQPRHEFSDLDLAARIGTEPVRPTSYQPDGFLIAQQVAPGAHAYGALSVPAGSGESAKLSLTGPRAGPVGPAAVPQLLVLRIR